MKKRIIKTITWILALTILVSNIASMDVHADIAEVPGGIYTEEESAKFICNFPGSYNEDPEHYYKIVITDNNGYFETFIAETPEKMGININLQFLKAETTYSYTVTEIQNNYVNICYYYQGLGCYQRALSVNCPSFPEVDYNEKIDYTFLYPWEIIFPFAKPFLNNNGFTLDSKGNYYLRKDYETIYEILYKGTFKTKAFTTVAAMCEGGTVTGNGNYKMRDTVTLTATAGTGYDQSTLVWSGETSDVNNVYFSSSNQLKLYIRESFYEATTYTPTATFSLIKYPVRVYESVEGEVDLTQEFEVQYGENITATVPERSGYRVEKWHVNGEDPMDGTVYESLKTSITTPVLNEDAVLYCYWLKEYMITGEADGFGTVEPASTGLIGDETVTLTATNTVYGTFSHWEKDGIDIGPGTLNDTGSELIVTNEKADHKYIAVFTQNEFDILINIKPGEEAGSATATPGENIQLDGCLLEATASIGYDFIQWENEEGLVDEVGKTAISVPYDGDASYDAIFEMKEKHAVTTSVISLSGSSIGNSVSKSLNIETGIEYPAGSSTYTNGSIITMTARDASSSEFVEWRLGDKNGPVASTDRTTTVTVSDENIHYVGIFKNKYFSVAANSNDVNKGTAAVAYSPILATQSTTVRAVAKEGYQFEYWLDESMTTILSYDANYTFTPQSSTTVIAFFDDVIVPQAIVNNVIAPIQEENNQLERTEITDAEVPATTLVDNEDSNNPEDTKESKNVNPDNANEELAEEASTLPLILSIIFGILFLVGLGIIVIIVKRKKTEK